jgi:hypothetical protein
LCTQIGLFFISLHKKLVGLAIQLPIDMPRGFTWVVMPILGEFDTEPMIRTAMQSRDETFHHLTCNQVNLIKIAPFFYLCKIFRNR